MTLGENIDVMGSREKSRLRHHANREEVYFIGGRVTELDKQTALSSVIVACLKILVGALLGSS